MKKAAIIFISIIGLILILILLPRTSQPSTTTWIINKTDGTSDTIEARKYWIVSPDSLFIKFEIDDTTKVIYSRYGIESFRMIKN